MEHGSNTELLAPRSLENTSRKSLPRRRARNMVAVPEGWCSALSVTGTVGAFPGQIVHPSNGALTALAK